MKLRWKLLLAGFLVLVVLVLPIPRDGSLVEAEGSGSVVALVVGEFEARTIPVQGIEIYRALC